MDRISIHIDGGNFYHLVLKKLGVEERQFDYDAFTRFLTNDRTLVPMGKRFYVGTVREQIGNPRSLEAMRKQTSFFAELKETNWEIKTSKLKTRTEEIIIDTRVVEHKELHKAGFKKITIERMREKGIDVKLATDLIAGAVDNQYDTAIVVSSDSDLIPAIDWIRHRGKKIEYVGFSIPDEATPKHSTTPLLSLIKKTDVQRILTQSDMESFIKRDLFTAGDGNS